MRLKSHMIALPSGLCKVGVTLIVTLSAAQAARGADDGILPSTGKGASYATACSNAWRSYSSATASYISANAMVSTQTQTFGGLFNSIVTYYANATTLCDGVARVDYSPAISLSTGLITGSAPVSAVSSYTITEWYGSPSGPSPSCVISPSDCDPLWEAYSSSLSTWSHSTAIADPSAMITPAPMPPNCMNQTEAVEESSIQSALSACGPCTIFGNGVQLVYFPVPTTVSRDMCASTPIASLTYYGSDAIIEAYAGTNYQGKSPNTDDASTAVVGKHTFTSGTAYISIGTVWAEDRCGITQGVMHDAILAMSSSSVLSLRYSQDHFEYFFLTNRQTGYPVSYADFNTPVPWSAYNGQAQCQGPYAAWPCSVIYADSYRPQLAIPPDIRQLNPAWATCQMWYGGLYDPPMALQPQSYVYVPTRPAWDHASSTAWTVSGHSVLATTAVTGDDAVTRPPTPSGIAITAATSTKAAQAAHETSVSVTVTNIVTEYHPADTVTGHAASSNVESESHSQNNLIHDSSIAGTSKATTRDSPTTQSLAIPSTTLTTASPSSSAGSGSLHAPFAMLGYSGIVYLVWGLAAI